MEHAQLQSGTFVQNPDPIQKDFRFGRASLLEGSLGLLPRGECGELRGHVELRRAEEVLQELRAAGRRAHVAEHRGTPGDGGGDVGPRAAAAEAPAGVHVDARGREARERSEDLAPALPRARAVRADPHLHYSRSARRSRTPAAMLSPPVSGGEAAETVGRGHSRNRHSHRHRRVAAGRMRG